MEQPKGWDLPSLERLRASAAWLLYLGTHDAPDYLSNHYRPPQEASQPHFEFVVNGALHGVEDVEYPVYD